MVGKDETGGETMHVLTVVLCEFSAGSINAHLNQDRQRLFGRLGCFQGELLRGPLEVARKGRAAEIEQ